MSCCLIFLISCRTPIDLESLGFEDLLVVEAFITDLDPIYQVTLSRTSPLGSENPKYESNSTVWILHEDGTRFDFPMTLPGVYQSESKFEIITGDSYQLFISTVDGLSYESPPIVVKSTPNIDSVFAYYDPTENVAQLSVATSDESGDSRNYRWIIEETYELTTPYPAEWKIVRDSLVPRIETATTCFKYNNPTNIFIETTQGKSQDRILDFPLRSLSPDDPHLRTKYSLLVKQYAITADSYLFWSQIREQSERQGGLFDVQPGSIQGNIVSTSNFEEMVLGYFDILKGNEQRVFYDHSDIPGYNQPPYEIECELLTFDPPEDNPTPFTPLEVAKIYTRSNLIFEAPNGEINFEIIYVNEQCGDCSTIADTNVPEFWND